MRPRLIRRAAAVIGVLALSATGLAAAGQTAASAKPAQRFHLVRTTAPLRVTGRPAVHAGARAALAVPSAGEAAADAALYRAHNANEADLEGGDAVHEGEVAAPSATSHSGTSGSKSSSWEGSNHFDSRYSGGGNQFSGEPPDQGLCANNTREFEIVNQVVQVYTRSGTPLLAGTSGAPGFTGPIGITLNEFFGFPPALLRTTPPVYGLFIFDVSCAYDSGVGRWYVSAAAFEQDPGTGDFTGQAHALLAVSTGSNPLGSFKVYDIDTTNNGTNGTPDHQCEGGFCFGDYPQLGFDANGVYITTNEFDLFGPNFHGAQLYAVSKKDLLFGASSPRTQVIENIFAPSVNDVAYTLMPVASLPQDYERAHGGTMYFGMTQSPFFDATANAVSLWRLTNTKSLSYTPNLSLAETSIPTAPYATPPASQQKAGDTPLLDCINLGCLTTTVPPAQVGPWPLDSGPGKIGAGWLRHGVVYLVAGVALDGPGGANISEDGLTWEEADVHAGVGYVALRPSTWNSSVFRLFQGSIDVKGQNLIYPSLAMNAWGKGAIGVTLSGPNWYPTSAYIPFSVFGPSGSVQIAAKGAGPNDGFSGTIVGGYRTRWGDYGAAATSPDGMLWVANEYIAQTCDLDTYLADPTCGNTRTTLANWSTRVVGIKG